MRRIWSAAAVLVLVATTHLLGFEPLRHDEYVIWKPKRNVKDPILKQIDQFGKDMKAKLGPKLLAHKPFIAVDDSPQAVALQAETVEQIVDRMLGALKSCADHDNEDFLPHFGANRRSPIAKGSDLVTEPIGGLTSVGQWSGNFTFKFEWEKVGGRFTNKWDQNDVDEAYELELNATLTLGISLTIANDRKLTVIDYSVARPVVTGWRTTLIASEGVVQTPISATPPKQKNGK